MRGQQCRGFFAPNFIGFFSGSIRAGRGLNKTKFVSTHTITPGLVGNLSGTPDKLGSFVKSVLSNRTSSFTRRWPSSTDCRIGSPPSRPPPWRRRSRGCPSLKANRLRALARQRAAHAALSGDCRSTPATARLVKLPWRPSTAIQQQPVCRVTRWTLIRYPHCLADPVGVQHGQPTTLGPARRWLPWQAESSRGRMRSTPWVERSPFQVQSRRLDPQLGVHRRHQWARLWSSRGSRVTAGATRRLPSRAAAPPSSGTPSSASRAVSGGGVVLPLVHRPRPNLRQPRMLLLPPRSRPLRPHSHQGIPSPLETAREIR